MEKTKSINNEFYDALEDLWLEATDHPIVLLQAENRVRNPWILETLATQKPGPCHILDIGCGAGLLSHALAEKGHQVTGIDASEGSLAVAREKNSGATFLKTFAENIPLADSSFDAVCAMDLLEHVYEPEKVLQEVSRLLKPGGLFFFHTFNRNWLSYLVVIKGVEWFVKNTPKNMHIYPLLIKPQELSQMLGRCSISIENIQGLVPDLRSKGFWKLLFLRSVGKDFRFIFSKHLTTGYLGWGRKSHPT